ncbi:MAG: hypothetical protein RL758_322 [Pseudomonadota bacterium]|jgi:hypothetical protein
MKHTPGPWHWVNSQTDEPFDFDAPFNWNGYPSLRTVDDFGETKKEVIDGQTYSSFALPKWILDAEPMQNGNDAANARLIAAAPDLLEACWAMVTSFHAVEYMEPHMQEAASHARAAIAKATGEQA